ncbi:MAG: large subunit ribosomal protein L10 [Planctomycetota bacterium]|jgi:large subunit ribosomal protein L10
MPNIVKELIYSELDTDFEGIGGLVMVSFEGLTVVESESLRNQLAEKGAKFRMVQNRIARRVLSSKGYDFPVDVMAGNTGIAYGDAEAAISAAKIFTEKSVKAAGKVKIKAGMLEDSVLNANDAVALAQIPDTDTLRAKLVGCISGPARGLVGTLAGLPSGLARVMQAHIDQGEGSDD